MTLCVAGSYDHCLLNQTLDGAGAAPCASEAGRYLFAHSDPANRIFVWGQRPDLIRAFRPCRQDFCLGSKSGIYLDAHRRPACRYITTFPLTGYVFGGPIPGFDTRSRILPGAWSTLEQDFARHPPTYIVDVQPDPKSAALSSEGLSDPGETLGGTVRASGAHCRRC